MTTQALEIAPRQAMTPEEIQLPLGDYYVHELGALEEWRDHHHFYDPRSELRLETHPVRVCRILDDFARGLIGEDVHRAALLHDIGQRANSRSNSHTAKEVLYNYCSAVSKQTPSFLQEDANQRWIYVSTLLSDLDKVESASEAYREDLEYPSALRKILDGNAKPQKPEDWLHESRLADPTKMAELLDSVNLESVLIKAAEMLDNLQQPHPTKNRAVLQDIHEAESFYAPLCEILGFDGLAMAIRSEASCLRLAKSGNGRFVQQAEEELANHNPAHAAALVEQLLHSIFAGPGADRDAVIAERVIGESHEHGIVLGEAYLDHELENRVIWRVKSVGSLALKIFQSANQQIPGDIIGITLVAKDTDDVASLYETLVRSTVDNAHLAPVPAPSRSEAYSVQGSDTFRSSVLGRIATRGLVTVSEIESKPKSNGYNVAKVTVQYQDPEGGSKPQKVEIQIQTADARTNGRIGPASHVIYKAKQCSRHIPPGVLADIRNRKSKLDPNSRFIVPGSATDGDKLRRAIASAVR